MKSLAIVAGVGLSVLFAVFAVTCTGKAPPANLSTTPSIDSPTPDSSVASPDGNLPLRTLQDVPLSGGASRFDYQSFDPNTGRLYIAHLGDGSLVVFDTIKQT